MFQFSNGFMQLAVAVHPLHNIRLDKLPKVRVKLELFALLLTDQSMFGKSKSPHNNGTIGI